MKKWLGPLALCLVLGVVTHLIVIYSAPPLIMDRAFTMLEKRGTPTHDFELAPRMTPETQSVVRPSPDLAYSICMFDLSQAPNGVQVTMAAYDGYSSLSFFDAQTNNFLTQRGEGKQHKIVLNADNAPSEKGVILIRRLAPSQEAYDAVVGVAPGDECRAL